MSLPARTPLFAARLLAGLLPLSVMITATVSAKQPGPVAPTVPAPAPGSIRPGPAIRFQPMPMPLSAPAPLQPGGVGNAGQGSKHGNDKDWEERCPETGPELSLGECIAIALERQPALKAAKDSALATQRGYEALTNFGTVGTIISPDLEIRKQQAYRGLMATSAEYQKLHNEIVQ